MDSAAGFEQLSAARVIRDIAYAPAEPATSRGHLLDLYLPASDGPAPLVIWTHGSAWLAENGRDEADVVAAQLNPHGYAVAGIAIRSSNHAQFPGQLYDIKAAIRWLRQHAAEYDLDPDRFAIMGESSGGWTAAMAALTGAVAELEGELGTTGPSSRVQAAVPFYLPTDFLQMDAHMIALSDAPAARPMPPPGDLARDRAPRPGLAPGQMPQRHADPLSPESRLVGGPIEQRRVQVQQANPISYVSSEAPPFLILHGELDRLVPYHQSLLLYEALSAACAEVSLVTLPHGEHGRWKEFLSDAVVSAAATIRSSQSCQQTAAQPVAPSWQLIISFLDLHLHGKPQ